MHRTERSRPTRRLPWIVLSALALVLAACQATGGSASPSNGQAAGSGAPTGAATPGPNALKVVTTTTVFADIVQNIGGARVAATSIIPPGVGPEDYEPKPDDAKKLSDAKLIVSNGVGLDDFLNDLLASGSGGQTPHLVLGEGIPVITVDGEENPHFWLDPTLVKAHYLPAIAAKLAEIDPDGKATFDANVAAYGAQLDALDTELKAEIATIPAANRKLVTFHDAFPYFAQHYGFAMIGVIQRGPVQPRPDPDPRPGGRHHEGRHDALQRCPRADARGHLSRPDALERRPDRPGPPVG
jgi:ABC-type Zn uptake system ZnuABC Zn-binding protein ZnuA